MLSPKEIHELRAIFRVTRSVSKTATYFPHRSPTTIRYWVTTNRQNLKRKKTSSKAKRNVQLRHRNDRIVSLARQMTMKKGREFPVFGSSRRISNALCAKYGTKCSKRQVCRVLRAKGLRSYKRPCVPTRDIKQMLVKLLFCCRTLQKSDEFFQHVAFSDETWLSCNEMTCSHMWAESRREVRPRERKSRWNVPCFQVWAVVAAGFKSRLVLMPAETFDDGDRRAFRLTADRYVRRCLQGAMPELVRRRLIFQQDGARSHDNRTVWCYLNSKLGDRWVDDWPGYAPDLSPIETVWNELKQRVGERCPMTFEELKVAAVQAWDDIPQETIDRHVLGFKDRLRRFCMAHPLHM